MQREGGRGKGRGERGARRKGNYKLGGQCPRGRPPRVAHSIRVLGARGAASWGGDPLHLLLLLICPPF
eukprot:3887923-Pyramimonas_sp.AAC.1